MILKEQVKAELKSKGVQIPVTAEDRQQISTREAITEVHRKYINVLARDSLADILGVSESALENILKL